MGLCGFLTNCCVESTMRTAYEKGFHVVTLTDCTATTSSEGQKAAADPKTGTYTMFSQPMTSAGSSQHWGSAAMKVWARSESPPGVDAWHAARLRAPVPRSGLGSGTCAWACARAARKALPERIRAWCAVLAAVSERALFGRAVHRHGILAATICYLSELAHGVQRRFRLGAGGDVGEACLGTRSWHRRTTCAHWS